MKLILRTEKEVEADLKRIESTLIKGFHTTNAEEIIQYADKEIDKCNPMVANHLIQHHFN